MENPSGTVLCHENFVRSHNKYIESLKRSNKKLPSSFGIRAV